jgi:hypothetical protein
MSPSHTNKGGARYRYYVSQAVLQKKPRAIGSIGRVPAAEIEALIVGAIRQHLPVSGDDPQSVPDNERELIEHHVERVTLTPKHINLQLRLIAEAPSKMGSQEHASDDTAGEDMSRLTTVAIPWTSPVPAGLKGIIHVPAHNTPMKPSRREALLSAIARARNWLNDLAHGRAASFAVIARRERMVERHVRLLAPLAFVSPRIVSALLDGTAPADLTVTTLARALPWSWAEQERCMEVQSRHRIIGARQID